jgi:hypothetical protein
MALWSAEKILLINLDGILDLRTGVFGHKDNMEQQSINKMQCDSSHAHDLKLKRLSTQQWLMPTDQDYLFC